MNVYENVLELIGHTPLVRLHKTEQKCGVNAEIYAKVERFNPGGSVKDRVAKQMIEDGMKDGTIQRGTLLIEATSGNTGIGLAMLGAYYGLEVVIVMPDTMSVERQQLMKAYGAKIVLSPGALGMQGAVELAEKLHAENPNSLIMGQFVNPSNSQAHYEGTGREILEDLDGKLDFFVAGIGTGGTISGVAKRLKDTLPNVQIVGVEPASSPLLSQGKAGKHGIEGIGANFVPGNLNQELLDRVIDIPDEKAVEMMRLLAREEGLLAGISSGAALAGAVMVAKDNPGRRIVTLLPDTGERYLSKNLF